MGIINKTLKTNLVLAILLCFACLFTATAQTITSNQTGNQGGYFYTFWTDGGGSVSMTLGSGGQFSVQWSNCGNFVCGKGWNPGGERTITWSGSASGAQYFGVYGWMTNPLVEYYIPRSGGSQNKGTYSADGTTYTLTVSQRVNQPSIEGTKTFNQYFAGGGGGRSVNFSQHLAGWRSLGMGVGSQNYQVVAVEGWGGSSGSANVTVGSGGSSSSTTTTSSGSTRTAGSTTTTSSGSSGSKTYILRARSTDGQGKVNLVVGGSTIASWTLSSGMSNYTVTSSASGSGILVQFTNDATNRDVQVDYLSVAGSIRQAESQSYNTAVYQNSKCGGSNSEWMHCNGAIGF